GHIVQHRGRSARVSGGIPEPFCGQPRLFVSVRAATVRFATNAAKGTASDPELEHSRRSYGGERNLGLEAALYVLQAGHRGHAALVAGTGASRIVATYHPFPK